MESLIVSSIQQGEVHISRFGLVGGIVVSGAALTLLILRSGDEQSRRVLVILLVGLLETLVQLLVEDNLIAGAEVLLNWKLCIVFLLKLWLEVVLNGSLNIKLRVLKILDQVTKKSTHTNIRLVLVNILYQFQ